MFKMNYYLLFCVLMIMFWEIEGVIFVHSLSTTSRPILFVRLSRLFYKTTCYIFILRSNPILTHPLSMACRLLSRGLLLWRKAVKSHTIYWKPHNESKVGMKERCLNLHNAILKHTRRGGISHLQSESKRKRRRRTITVAHGSIHTL